MAGVSVGFAKCFIMFMAVVILVQGGIYIWLGYWGLARRECTSTAINLADDPLGFATDLIYFVDEDCGNPEFIFQGYTLSLTMDWDDSYEITHREFIFLVTYITVSALWVVTSVLIITTLCVKTTNLISGVIYWPWFLFVLAGCILDVVATVYHSIDISHTMTLDDTFSYIGASKPDVSEALLSQLETFGAYFSTPAILLTCLSCRFVVIWLLNLFGGAFCLSFANVLAKQNAAKKPSVVTVPPSQAPTRQQTPQPQLQVAIVEEVQQQPTAPTPQIEYVEQYPEQIRPKPLQIVVPAHNAEIAQRQDSGLYRPSDRTTLQSPVAILPPQLPAENPTSPQPQADVSTYRTTEAHPDRLNYPVADATPSPVIQQLSPTSHLNTRYSEAYPIQSQPNPRVSQELRNQMPWSYTSMLTKPPPPPRKPQQQVQIYPQIPEPDYTEH